MPTNQIKIIITNTKALKMNKPNARQKRLMSDIAEWANDHIHELYGAEWFGAHYQLHHVTGRSYIQNKTPIGHEFILPVPIALHDVGSNHALNVTHHPFAFISEFGWQRDLFATMIKSMLLQGYKMPHSEVLNAIRSTSK